MAGFESDEVLPLSLRWGQVRDPVPDDCPARGDADANSDVNVCGRPYSHQLAVLSHLLLDHLDHTVLVPVDAVVAVVVATGPYDVEADAAGKDEEVVHSGSDSDRER